MIFPGGKRATKLFGTYEEKEFELYYSDNSFSRFSCMGTIVYVWHCVYFVWRNSGRSSYFFLFLYHLILFIYFIFVYFSLSLSRQITHLHAWLFFLPVKKNYIQEAFNIVSGLSWLTYIPFWKQFIFNYYYFFII